MTAKLYIGNIAYNICEEDLCILFAEVGKVVASRVIADRVTGRSRGFGFVEMGSQSEAEDAISKFNGYSLLGRTLLVYLAHDDKELSRRVRESRQKPLTPSRSVLAPEYNFYNQSK